VDVDGDGRITYQEMRAFYNVQLQRMEWLGHELVPFDDVLAQMLDMLKPSDRDRGLVFEDFLVPDRIKITGTLPPSIQCVINTSDALGFVSHTLHPIR
jgi:serine/threonine-protein phosphatase 2A regulatory subunit B''